MEPEQPLIVEIMAEETPVPAPVPKNRRRNQPADVAASVDDPAEPEATEPESEDPEPLSLVVAKPQKTKESGTPKTAPPSVDEWQDFLGRIVIRSLADGYVALMLRDIELTERELASISLSREDLAEISAPLASMAQKSKVGRRHGRKIIAASDSFEAVAAMVIWMRRVRRLARKHAKKQTPQQQPVNGTVIGDFNGYSGENVTEGPVVGGGYAVFNPGTG